MNEIPACHQWPVDWPAIRRALWDDPPALPENVPYKSLGILQAGRCAICGITPRQPDTLQEDHDHRTGLVRGRLCASCNVLEGTSPLPIFDLYRKWHPTKILGLELIYQHPLGFDPAPRREELEPGYDEAVRARRREITSDLARVMRCVPKHLGGEGLTPDEMVRQDRLRE